MNGNTTTEAIAERVADIIRERAITTDRIARVLDLPIAEVLGLDRSRSASFGWFTCQSPVDERMSDGLGMMGTTPAEGRSS